MTADFGEVLSWDSEFFGFRIGRIGARELAPRDAPSLFEWARGRELACISFLVDANDSGSIRAAEDMGFRHVDLRVTRERALERASVEAVMLERAREEDLPALLAIARRSHHATRFYRDPRFPDERCDEFYARWLQRGFEDPSQEVLVVRDAGEPASYLVCSGSGSECGQIGLVAVAEGARGSGAGTSLVRGALHWMVTRGCVRAEVVSQGHEVAANRLYEREGFLTSRVEYWFHLWLDETGR